jgi:hypothetical protein
MSEQQFQQAVIQLIRVLGLHWYHTADSRRSNRGWPDLVVYGSRIIYRELKTKLGKLTMPQVQCGEDLKKAGGDWAVWRPEDLQSGRIRDELLAIR